MASTATSAVGPSPQEAPPGPIYVDTQHEDLVHDAQLDYYGCKLATSSSGKKDEPFVFSRRSLSDLSYLSL
jgi:hypothetical protein